MARRRSIITLQLIVTLAASLFMLAAEAIQLGDLRTHSAMGQPLDATVGVWLTTNDKAQPLRLKVSPDIAYRSNSAMATIVAGISVELATTANGTPYIQLRSDSVINEPVLAFRVKVYVGENAVMRNYSLALNPAPPVRRSTSRRNTRSVEPITDSNYTVAAGDTLWAIARRVGRTTGTGTSELVTQIFAENPHAFVNGNRDQLIRGAALRLPLASNATVASESAAPQPVAATRPAAAAAPARVTVPTAIVTDTTTTQAATVAPVEAPTPTQASAAPQRSVDWRQRDPQLAAELERLRLKYRALKQQYDTQRSGAEADAATLAPIEEQAVVASVDEAAGAAASQAADSAVALVADDGVTAMAAGEATGFAAQDSAATSGSTQGLSAVTIVALITAGIALLLLITVALRKGLGMMKKRRAEVAHHAREADFKAEVARKAANRVQMESEVQRMLANRDAPAVQAASIPAPAAVEASADSGSGTDAEIDQNIAHGRYNEAEAQLISVIAANPKNYAAKLRLLEVYYMIEQVDSFCDVADDLHVHHRADLSDDEWRRVIRMGKITAPDRMPFSGPRALGSSNAAS